MQLHEGDGALRRDLVGEEQFLRRVVLAATDYEQQLAGLHYPAHAHRDGVAGHIVAAREEAGVCVNRALVELLAVRVRVEDGARLVEAEMTVRADAEHLQRTNPAAFRHEYGGEVVGSGAAVFANLQLRAVPDDELERYDRVYYGVDWGWYPDPWAYNAAAYDAARRVLVIFDELTRSRTPNRETAELLLARGAGTDGPLTADAAEPKSCADYRAAGLPCRAAQKGPGSVRESMKWLQGLAAIIIDPVRCPATAAEFSEYEYERDPRTGEVLPGYPDVNNHHIDAVRYALESVWRRRGS